VISSRYFSIALSNERTSYHLGALDSGKINGQTTLYLGVAADMPALQLVDIVPLRFKIGAPEDVDKLVLSAMPGVKLVHAPQVPARCRCGPTPIISCSRTAACCTKACSRRRRSRSTSRTGSATSNSN
jgi:predicted component of type VI protein secretion system